MTLSTLWENEGEREALRCLEQEGIAVNSFQLNRTRIVKNAIRGILSPDPLQAWYSWEPDLFNAVSKEIRVNHYDIIQLEHLRSGVYLRRLSKQIRSEQITSILVWDAVDCISRLFEQSRSNNPSRLGRQIANFELPRTKRMEDELLKKADQILVTSKYDRAAFLEANNEKPIEKKVLVLPNGVDLSYFQPADLQRNSETILFSGKLSYHANISAALFLSTEIMPIVWRERPDAILQLVGKDPPSILNQIAQKERRIDLPGSVPDMRPYLHKATLAAASLQYGTGIQNKVLEAMACGTPVIATPQAISGFDHLEPGKEILLAQDAAAFANEILTLLGDAGLRAALSGAGVEYVRRWHNWDQLSSSFTQNLEILLQNNRSDGFDT